MKRLLFILLILVFVSCNVNSKKSVDDVLLFKDFETYLMENEVADDDIIISISGFIDSVNDCRDNVNKYYLLFYQKISKHLYNTSKHRRNDIWCNDNTLRYYKI